MATFENQIQVLRALLPVKFGLQTDALYVHMITTCAPNGHV